jgi:hypothetical protein
MRRLSLLAVFRTRRGDMKKLLLATRGKVFPFKTLDKLVDAPA